MTNEKFVPIPKPKDGPIITNTGTVPLVIHVTNHQKEIEMPTNVNPEYKFVPIPDGEWSIVVNTSTTPVSSRLMPEFRILRKKTDTIMSIIGSSFTDTLQQKVLLCRGNEYWEEWEDVPIVEETLLTKPKGD